MAAVSDAAVAIFPWGDVIEEFLDPLGLTIEDYAERMRGGWLFGYVAGLQAHGLRPLIIYASERVEAPLRLTHADTGAPIWLVPGRRTQTTQRPSLNAVRQWRRTPFGAFADILRSEACGAILVQDYEHPRFEALSLLGRRLKLPVFATFQGGDVTLSALERRVRGPFLRRCAGLVVASARERGRLEKTYGVDPARIHPIPNPVDLDFWTPEPRLAARQVLGVAADELVVFNHGRIDVRRKGLDVLIEAWRQFSQGHANARLVVLGSGQDREAFAGLVGQAPRVDWLSSYVTDPPLIRRWLSAADIYVTLSRVEGMPVAPLEAMACGLPVVASDAHGLADIFEAGEAAGGLVVPREDASAAAAALASLADATHYRHDLGRRARAHVEGRYSIDAVGRDLGGMIRSR